MKQQNSEKSGSRRRLSSCDRRSSERPSSTASVETVISTVGVYNMVNHAVSSVVVDLQGGS